MNPTQERWLPVPGYEGYYEVSDHGRVRSVDRRVSRGQHHLTVRGAETCQYPNRSGYLIANLQKDNVSRSRLVHRLVMLAFGGPPVGDGIVCHNDGNPANNHLSNLRWDTHSANMYDKRDHGTDHQANKTHCPLGHPLSGPNVRARDDVRRGCKACNRAHAKKSLDPSINFQEYADYQYRRIAAGDAPFRNSHCRRGHEMTEANSYYYPSKPGRECRACRDVRKQAESHAHTGVRRSGDQREG